jgi:hypothetical protein
MMAKHIIGHIPEFVLFSVFISRMYFNVCIRGGAQKPALAPWPLKIYMCICILILSFCGISWRRFYMRLYFPPFSWNVQPSCKIFIFNALYCTSMYWAQVFSDVIMHYCSEIFVLVCAFRWSTAFLWSVVYCIMLCILIHNTLQANLPVDSVFIFPHQWYVCVCILWFFYLCHKSEDHNQHFQHCGNLKSRV